MKKPNILLIMCDQMRADALGCNGNTAVKTPNIDRLAASGANFPSAYTPNPICVPARACLTTGFYPHKCTGTKNNSGGVIREGFPLLGDELSKRGYTTYAMGKLHYLPYTPPGTPKVTHGLEQVEITESGRWCGDYQGAAGLEEYIDYLKTVGWGGYSRAHGIGNNDIFPTASPLPEEHYVDSWVAGRSIEYMKKHMRECPEKPFFMWASFPKPHSPYDPPRPYDAMYDPRTLPPPSGSIDDIKSRGLDALYKTYLEYGWNTLSDAAKQVILAHYYGLVSFQDKQVGRMLDFLEAEGVLEDTIVIYTADHGDMMGDFGLYFKQLFYRGSVNIPFVISYPRALKQGIVSGELAGLQDILPTLLSLTGEPLSVAADGSNIVPVVNDGLPLREFYVSQCLDSVSGDVTGRFSHQRYMLADKQYKYIYHECGGIEELYDLTNDPHELVNLSDSCAERLGMMRERLYNWCVENEDRQILDNGALKKSPRPDTSDWKPNKNPFGRRIY